MAAASTNVTLSWDGANIISLTFICLLLPLVLVGNVLVILSVARYRRLQIPTNMFITSLSISDILSGCFSPFLIVVEYRRDLITDVQLCVAPYCGVLMGISVSVMTLAAIAFDRYTACVFPMEYVYVITFPRIVAILTTTWLLGVTLTWVVIMALSTSQPASLCSVNIVPQHALVILLTVVFLPCGIFIFYCYFKIYLVARHHVLAIAAIERSVKTEREIRHFQRDTKYAKTLGIVISGFLLLSLPLEISILLNVASGLQLDESVLTFCVLLAMTNGAINPWIYAFRNAEFRSAFRSLLRDCSKFAYSSNQKRNDSQMESNLSRADSRLENVDLIRTLYDNNIPGSTSVISSIAGRVSPKPGSTDESPTSESAGSATPI